MCKLLSALDAELGMLPRPILGLVDVQLVLKKLVI
jgi:hypothetical protein